jgi:hypothetical protein
MVWTPQDLPIPVTNGVKLSNYTWCVFLTVGLLVRRSNIATATSVDVERIFSRGRLLLSHVRNRLSVETTRALLCIGLWSQLGLVKDKDIDTVASLPDVVEEDETLDDGWDSILLD